jgi:hypothetical protein
LVIAFAGTADFFTGSFFAGVAAFVVADFFVVISFPWY